MALLKTLRIERKFWGRGVETGGYLLREDDSQRMCCLGFYARACGLAKKDIRGVGTPEGVSIRAKVRNKAAWQLMFEHEDGGGNPSIYKLAADNDDRSTADAEKESRIKKGFAKLGVKVRFVGKG